MTPSWPKAWGVPVVVVPAGMPTINSTRFGDTFDIYRLVVFCWMGLARWSRAICDVDALFLEFNIFVRCSGQHCFFFVFILFSSQCCGFEKPINASNVLR